ncbi:MAG: hypothetical protein M1819_006855 [Sarea resinae]|nr:MAG: hypothetical protein M1819_006855 [Sarea resinae]
MDCSSYDAALSNDPEACGQLPAELVEIIQRGSSREYLDALSAAALEPTLTITLFSYYEPLFADICGRWISLPQFTARSGAVLATFGRILPFAPHLAAYAEALLRRPEGDQLLNALSPDDGQQPMLSDWQLQDLLLAIFRLLVFDNETFGSKLRPSKLQPLLRHECRPIRYLAVRILSLYLHAADAATKRMLDSYLGDEAVEGEWEGKDVDYGFLSLWEEKRLKAMEDLLVSRRTVGNTGVENTATARFLAKGDLSDLTAEACGVLLPRLQGHPSDPSFLVSTPTTAANMRRLAEALLTQDPLLVTGLPGSGKTVLVADLARELNVASSMVTLHLNEQTDAKLLIGMYTTGSTPGSFAWRSGVLTTAVREGRWVFIEDIDRAPTEVISVILPLLERGELLIPNRGEKVRAARGFKLIATMRTSVNARGEEALPNAHMLGNRLWRHVQVQMPSEDEFQEIISRSFPLLHGYLTKIMDVYRRVLHLHRQTSFVGSAKVAAGRPISPRDLLKWCRRIDALLSTAGALTGNEAVPETVSDDIFREAADCFSGSLSTDEARIAAVSCIAEEMHVPPQRVQYYLQSYVPRYTNSEKMVQIGRARLLKRKTPSGIRKRAENFGKRPFATNGHTLRLLERIGVAVRMAEPVLLVGETGTGKTTVVQQLADNLGRKLSVVNLSQQSESGDLLGGFKPVNIRSLAIPMKEEFDDLFGSTFSLKKNQRYLDMLGKSLAKGQWTRASTLWNEALKMVEGVFGLPAESLETEEEQKPNKRRKVDSPKHQLLKGRWEKFATNVKNFDSQLSSGSKSFAFTFVEGNIVKAARNGEWVLLDEINLASPDTLESIADLLYSGSGGTPSILLSETGDVERIQAHPDFRIFGAMNPATDIGKKDLPMGLRSRFTEIYVQSPDRDYDDLLTVVEAYLGSFIHTDDRAAHDISRLYLETKRHAENNRLVDGANQRPHFSLRTLTRTLSYVTEIAPVYGLRRALYEGFSMSFLTPLDKESEALLVPLIDKHLLGSHRNARAMLSQTPKIPNDGKQYVPFKHYWMPQGAYTVEEQPHYIITPFVERNMLNLVRATSTRRFPVLIQGPTSSGKTSMVEYFAKITGNKFVRINNHEHTDLQEYLGTYVSRSDGTLQFQEGILVQALREGHWIVLDELNLAPTDVLEALNRLLDDNRELLIPETQEVVRPHGNFMLFATQNPAGLYGGRKVLSRAFRNRFLELHFDDIPEDELETILRERSQIAPSFCSRIVAVYKELSLLRQTTRLFEQRNSFATLRDLFRWALRKADDREQLAINGFMLLAERVRKLEERQAVRQVIEKVMKVKIDEEALYNSGRSPEIQAFNDRCSNHGVVWTKAMRRLYILVSHALRNKEPVLLVGETGCGKTTVCQMLAEAFEKKLFIVNAHQNMETGDLIGAQRPIRNRGAIEKALLENLLDAFRLYICPGKTVENDLPSLLESFEKLDEQQVEKCPMDLRQRILAGKIRMNALFEWSDGSLVEAMKSGQYFLLDEISLADDSVLERLNSVLEPQRTLLLAEKGPDDALVVGSEGFQFLATMNPGGDYGKRELSPALRNRFTEIWVPSLSDVDDVLLIVRSKLSSQYVQFSEAIVAFAEWFGATYNFSSSSSISIRDILAWVNFVNNCPTDNACFAILHGAAMVYIDTLGASPAAMLAISGGRIHEERERCLSKLGELLRQDVSVLYHNTVDVLLDEQKLTIGHFSITRVGGLTENPDFNLKAPTTTMNAMRVIRALQLRKPLLLEGNPGVGKTTLVAALASAVGKPLTRINLSDQTDLMDLFGSDVPVEGAEAGHFAWRDAPFLQAMQKGEWVLLDEMNLASQSVLEGLNACLDHRGEVYISELNQTFTRHPDFVVFAAQNPHHQGGGRKGLPASFVNRFTVVYADVFQPEDMILICRRSYPNYPQSEIERLINFVVTLDTRVTVDRSYGAQGGPWEFNLRDILRWLKLVNSKFPLFRTADPGDYMGLLFQQRFRTAQDRLQLMKLHDEVFRKEKQERNMFYNLSETSFQVGLGMLARHNVIQPNIGPLSSRLTLPLEVTESLIICIQQRWPAILVGPPGSGKTVLLRQLAALAGAPLVEFTLNADIDTMDLVGGYEQVDPQRQLAPFLDDVKFFVRNAIIKDHASGSSPSKVLLELDRLCSNHVDAPTLRAIFELLGSLSESHSSLDLLDISIRCEQHLNQPLAVDKARFEWADGALVQALEQGKWLVLDNANLCSSSVLDRLNSLLEPNGSLILNEHRTPDGQAKVVEPHPNFRLFLTMDPQYGELSRAMRNRAIEIFLMPQTESEPQANSGSRGHFALESSVSRYRLFERSQGEKLSDHVASKFAEVSLDHLSISDSKLLRRWHKQLTLGLLADPEARLSLATERLNHDNSFLHGWIQELSPCYTEYATIIGADQNFWNAQPIHPLTNPFLIQLEKLAQCNQNSYRLTTLYELLQELQAMEQQLNVALRRSNSRKVSQMTRLERSIASNRLHYLSKDSTSPVGQFLVKYIGVLSAWSQNAAPCQPSSQSVISISPQHLKEVTDYWWDIFHLVQSTEFEESVFQVHLSIGRSIVASYTVADEPSRSLTEGIATCLDAFTQMWQLSSGLSMERLWMKLRPETCSSMKQLQTLLRLEQLADRFDDMVWKVKVPLANLSNIRHSVGNAVADVLLRGASGEQLLHHFEEAVEELEAKIGEEATADRPYFRKEFEAICQHMDLYNSSCSPSPAGNTLDPLVSIFANRPSKLIEASGHSNASKIFDELSHYSGTAETGAFLALRGSFPVSVLNKINGLGEVTLQQLELLQLELRVIGHSASGSSNAVTSDQVEILNGILWTLAKEIFTLHAEFLTEGFLRFISEINPSSSEATGLSSLESYAKTPGLALQETLPEDHYFRMIFQVYLMPCVQYLLRARQDLETSHSCSAMAWVYFSLGSLLLYVPDKSFDPALRPYVERQRHNERQAKLQLKLQALQYFEKHFTGQLTNIRCQQVEKDIKMLGEEPLVHAIARPQKSELNQLQGEFTNLLNTIVRPAPESNVLTSLLSGNIDALQESNLLRANTARIIERLSQGFRAYDDITLPIVGMLRSFDIGLTLATLTGLSRNQALEEVHAFSQRTLFLGAQPSTFMQGVPESLGSLQSQLRLHYLQTTATIQSVDGISSFSRDLRQNIFEGFHNYYMQWKDQLASDQEKAAARSGLYRYRGDEDQNDDAEIEEFRELFPDYEVPESDESLPSPSQTEDPKQLAIKLSGIHADVFTKKQPASKILQSMLESSAIQIGRVTLEPNQCTPKTLVENLLAGVLVSIDKAAESLTSPSDHGRTYNFYTDMNLAEANKLLALTRRIQNRFLSIQETWPEHATLQDVIGVCKELFATRHIEPVAKFITKAEKLHAFLSEWQVVASKEFSAASLQDELTSLLVSWRQLELSTWARLFDIEKEKCDEDAQGWWFVAYEVIVAAPLSLIESGEGLDEHAKKLLGTLQEFLTTTTMGQYSQRLRLLEQLREHLALLAKDMPPMAIIHNALINFIIFFSRFEGAVNEVVAKGRQKLEKDMKEVVLLASWRDANVIALRDSAKRSHRKLFRLVKKYRTLLAQPVENILRQGIPDILPSNDQFAETSKISIPERVDERALLICQSSVPRWNSRPARFTNIATTVASMGRMSQTPANIIGGSEYLESFCSDFITAIADLRKETPSTLTEENKDVVKHLKSRKRKLMADTLREIRQMGFKSNLSADALAKQSSPAAILATAAPFVDQSERTVVDADLYMHRLLDLLPRVREAVREHSEEITGAEIVRSAGYIEGLLYVILKQREALANALDDLTTLSKTVEKMQNLWAPDQYTIQDISIASIGRRESLQRTVRWLPSILAVGSHVVKVHAKLSQLESTKSIIEGLASRQEAAEVLRDEWNALPLLPEGISTSTAADVCGHAERFLQELRQDVVQWVEEYPVVAFVVKQILPWVELWSEEVTIMVNGETRDSSRLELADIDHYLSIALDSTLVALQRMQEKMALLPSSTDDPSWFAKEDASQTALIRSLHARDICSLLEDAMGKLRHLDLQDTPLASAASALFAVMLPIVRQYEQVYQKFAGKYAQLHRSTCKMSYILSKSFTQIASEGFCTPAEKSAAEDGKTEKTEGGTGLGEGEGAEDISKDIQEDEDLSELAQQPDVEKDKDREEIEDEKDAVDMQQDELEGEMGDAPEKEEDEEGGSDGEGEDDEIDEEAGGVDDLDPNAVDEKLWDGGGEEAEKDKEGDNTKGSKKEDEQVAAEESKKEKNQEGAEGDEEEIEEEGAEEGEEVRNEEMEKTDPHAEEGDVLDLPEEMNLDGDKGSEGEDDIDDDMMDELSDIEQEGADKQQPEGPDQDEEEGQAAEEDQASADLDFPDLDAGKEEEEGAKTEDAGDKPEEQDIIDENQEGLLRDQTDEAAADNENAAPSDVQGLGGEQNEEQDHDNRSSNAKQTEGAKKESDDSGGQDAAAEDGQKGQASSKPEAGSGQEDDAPQENRESQAFKKLGDALERWHRQQKEIRQATEQEGAEPPQEMDIDAENAEFEHLPDDDTHADTQALGSATEDQAHTLDESKALDSESKKLPDNFLPDEEPEQQDMDNDIQMEDSEPVNNLEPQDANQTRSGAIIGGAENQRQDEPHPHVGQDQDEDLLPPDDLDTQLSQTHLEPTSLASARSDTEARALWTHHESLTRALSFSLTEQLRLILAPTLATKMRGDFRTGKRLNIKRIIPYIASQYRRDKIWMRRSVPSKRTYQIMLAVDDSKSMAESGAKDLAFNTLALISRSLSMLEVGEICVVGFGNDVTVAHPFDAPFSADAGAKVFQHFGFDKTKTDVRALLTQSLSLFREARLKSSHSGGGANADLWQLELIISDGVCEDHESIRRLVRQAHEERIMIVFVIVDALRGGGGSSAGNPPAPPLPSSSIMDMSTASFEPDPVTGEMKLRMKRYLDGFPFAYYLVVGDVRELPGVLATALRLWFAEVVDAGL